MGVFDNASTRTGMKKLFQLLSLVSLIYGIVLFVGFLTGAKSMLHPLDKFTTSTSIVQNGKALVAPVHIEAKAGYSIEKLKEEVAASTKPVVVDFRKKSCASCDELEEFTFPDPRVQEELKRFTFITIDVTADTDDEKALMRYYTLFGTPSIIFFDKENKPLPEKTISGFQKAEKFAKHLKTIN